MAAHRFGDPLTDGEIDRALATALAVEPSPEFVARVRMRIASEPEPSDWRLSWLIAAGACTLALAVAVTVVQMNHPALAPGQPTLGGLSFLPALLPGPPGLAALASLRVRREKPTPEMQTIMKSNAAANTALAAHVQERNYDAIIKDAVVLRQNLAETEAFWAERRMDAAVNITRVGLQELADLQAAALANDDAAIARAAAAVTGTCGACHRQYRDQRPDKSYEIRL